MALRTAPSLTVSTAQRLYAPRSSWIGAVPMLLLWQPAAAARPTASRIAEGLVTGDSLTGEGELRGAGEGKSGSVIGHEVDEADGRGASHDHENRGEDEEHHGEEELDAHLLSGLFGSLGPLFTHAPGKRAE